jgi:hypothetical protein
VRHRPRGEDDRTLPRRHGRERARLILGWHLFERRHPDDLHETTERQRFHAVLGLRTGDRLEAVTALDGDRLRPAATGGPDRRTEPDEELRDLDAGPPCRQEVAELVEEDREQDHHGERDDADGPGHQIFACLALRASQSYTERKA